MVGRQVPAAGDDQLGEVVQDRGVAYDLGPRRSRQIPAICTKCSIIFAIGIYINVLATSY